MDLYLQYIKKMFQKDQLDVDKVKFLIYIYINKYIVTYPQRPQETGQLLITFSTSFSLPDNRAKIGAHLGHSV